MPREIMVVYLFILEPLPIFGQKLASGIGHSAYIVVNHCAIHTVEPFKYVLMRAALSYQPHPFV